MTQMPDDNKVKGWLERHAPSGLLASDDEPGSTLLVAIQSAGSTIAKIGQPVGRISAVLYPLIASGGMIYLLYAMPGQHEYWWLYSYGYMLLPPLALLGLAPWSAYIKEVVGHRHRDLPEIFGPLLVLVTMVFSFGAYVVFPNTNDYYQAQKTLPTLEQYAEGVESLQTSDRPVTLGNLVKHGSLDQSQCEGVLTEQKDGVYQCGLDEQEEWSRMPFDQGGFGETTMFGRVVQTNDRYLLELKKADSRSIDESEYEAFRREIKSHDADVSVAGFDREDGRLFIDLGER